MFYKIKYIKCIMINEIYVEFVNTSFSTIFYNSVNNDKC